MSSEETVVQTLIKLGLSILESRIYIALCKQGSLNTKELSKLTKTSRPDVYRVLDKLQNKGLVEKIIKKPARFKAVPLERGINFLVKRRKIEHDTLLAKADLLLHTLEKKGLKAKPVDPIESQFILIPQREIVVRRIRDAIDRSEKSVDIFLSWRRLVNGMTSVFIDNSKRAWDRGVHFRIVVESPEGKEAQKQALQFSKLSPFCSIRFLSEQSQTVMGIYDKKEVFIIVNPKEGLYDSPALWSNNQSLITAIQEYFELLWLVSMKNPEQCPNILNA